MIQWDCPGLQLAIHREGTLNKSKDKDKQWSVEMAIPHKAFDSEFLQPWIRLETAGVSTSHVCSGELDSVKKTGYGCLLDASICTCPTDGDSCIFPIR